MKEFKKEYSNYGSLSKSTLHSLITRFGKTGSVLDRKRPGPLKKLTYDVLEDIQERMSLSPNKSVRRLSAEMKLSVRTCHKAIRKELTLYPYRVKCLQELHGTDFDKRVKYCNWFQSNMTSDILDLTFFSDES